MAQSDFSASLANARKASISFSRVASAATVTTSKPMLRKDAAMACASCCGFLSGPAFL